MPKITVFNEKIQHSSGETNLELEINYMTGFGFYIVIPNSYLPTIESCENELKEFKIDQLKKKGKVLKADTESKLKMDIRSLFSILMTKTVTRRNVIIITGSVPNDRIEQFISPESKIENLEVSIDLKLKFCTEVKTGDNDPKYYRFSTYRWSTGIEESREHVYVQNSRYNNNIIIDDTEENRKGIVQIYNALVTLKQKLRDYTANESAVMQLLSVHQTLLPNN